MAPILGGYINIYRRTVRGLNEAGGAHVHVLWKNLLGSRKEEENQNPQRRQILQYGYKSVKLNSERTLKEDYYWKRKLARLRTLQGCKDNARRDGHKWNSSYTCGRIEGVRPVRICHRVPRSGGLSAHCTDCCFDGRGIWKPSDFSVPLEIQDNKVSRVYIYRQPCDLWPIRHNGGGPNEHCR